MGNLIKPVDYANQMGISRQAVYAKIKKGILTSKNIGGKIFIVANAKDTATSNKTTPKSANKANLDSPIVAPAQSHEKLLEAKDETITILKETIVDLKDTNKMITATLRSEVELLKDAFGEMKMLYGLQLEHKKQSQVEEATEDEAIEVDSIDSQDPEEWIELDDFFALHGIKKDKKQKKIKKSLKKRLKKGDTRIDVFDGDMVFLATAEFDDILKKG